MSLKKTCPKNYCEICEESYVKILHRHHIIERTELMTTNHPFNLVVVCANCHGMIHAGRIKVLGVYPGTKGPAGRIVVFIKDGVCNYPELEHEGSYYKPKLKSMKLF